MATTTEAVPRGRRGRPTKGELKEGAILEAAESLLAERSFGEISVDELARAAGISRPNFYFYFGSKEDVLLALVDRIAEGLMQQSVEIAERLSSDPRAAFEAAIAATARAWREHPAVARAAVETWGSVPRMGELWDRIITWFVDVLTPAISAEQKSGHAPVSEASARNLANALVLMNERCFYAAAIGSEVALPEGEIVPTLAEIWMRAVYGAVPASR